MYEPEEIVDTRHKRGKKEVLVKWVGYGSDDNSWEPLHNFDTLDVWKKYQLKSEKAKKEVKLEKSKVEEKQETRRRGKERKYLMKLEATSCSPTQEDSDEVEPSSHYKVERILKERSNGSIKEFLVRWDGYDSTHDTWEPEEGVGHTSVYDKWVATKSKKRKPKRPLPPRKRQKRKPTVISEKHESEEDENTPQSRELQKEKPSVISEGIQGKEVEKPSPPRKRRKRKPSIVSEENEIEEAEQPLPPRKRQKRKPSVISEDYESEEVAKPSTPSEVQKRKLSISEEDESETVEESSEISKSEALASLDRYMRRSFKFPCMDEFDDDEESSYEEDDEEEYVDSEEMSTADTEDEGEKTEESTESDVGKTYIKKKVRKVSGSVRKSRLKQAGEKKRKINHASHIELSMLSRATQQKVEEIESSKKVHKFKRLPTVVGTLEQRIEAAEKKKVEIWKDIRTRGLAREFGKRYPRAMPRRKFVGETPERVREALDAEILFKQIKCIPKEAKAIAKEIYSWRWEDD